MLSTRAIYNSNSATLINRPKTLKNHITAFVVISGFVLLTIRYKNYFQDYFETLNQLRNKILQIDNSTHNVSDFSNQSFLLPREKVYHLTKYILRQPCAFPELQPFGAEILPLIHKIEPVNCPQLANTFGKRAFGQIRGENALKRLHDLGTSCCYREFTRINDIHYSDEGRCFDFGNETTITIPEEMEFIEVECEPVDNEKLGYRDGFAFINRKLDVEKNNLNVDNVDNKLSVIILGLDATSRLNFLRMSPKSNEYLLKNLSAIEMKGYTKVGENTYPNLIPLFTGETVEEFENGCINSSKSPWELNLDDCPFVWKEFGKNGYKTGYAEDDTTIGNFYMYFIKPFDKPPTDYYLNTFSRLMVHKHSTANKLCFGTRTPFKILLDNLENFAEVFKEDLYFHFTWSTRYSHDDFNLLSISDEDLLKFLQFMDTSGNLNRTVLILLSDHGSRLDDIRATEQGKIEDRMPLLYFVFPTWFPLQYAEAYENLKGNINRLTSPFDVYETLKDFMNLGKLNNFNNANLTNADDSPMKRTPLSLFTKIPPRRSCFQAGVNLQWCVCHKRHRIRDLNSQDVQKAVKFSIQSMNKLLKDQTQCSQLLLNQTTDAFRLAVEGKLEVLRVSFTTTPGDGAFEATVIKDEKETLPGQNLGLAERVVRTNYYGDQGKCTHQDAREYCSCL